MSDLQTTITLSDDDKDYLEEILAGHVERIAGALEDIVANMPDTTPKHPNSPHIKNGDMWEHNPDYVRAWVRFDAFGGAAMELPAGSVSWHPEIRWERHDDGTCWEVEPRYLSERRMKQLEKQHSLNTSAHLAAALATRAK